MIIKHALRNALIPVVTIGTLLFGELLAGAVLTEQIFTIPGFGKLIVDAVFNRDYAVVQGVVLCTAIGYIVLNLLADVLYVVAQPAPEDTLMTIALDTAVQASRGAAEAASGASCCAAAPPPIGADRWSGCSSLIALARRRASCPAIRSGRSGRQSASRRARCTGSGPTNSAATCWRACSPARGPRCWPASISVTIAVAIGGPLGVAAGLFRRLDRRHHLALHRGDARLPVPDPRHRARQRAGRQPHQRDDRDRHRGRADLHPADARADAERQDRGLRGGRAGGRPAATAGSSSATSSRTSSRRSWCRRR